MMRTALFALGGAAVALAVVLLANAATYRSRQIPAEPAPAIALDTAAAAERLAHALRFRTISFGGASGVDTTSFPDFPLYLQRALHPQRSVYLAFGADEEVGGTGAKAIAALLASRNVHPAFIVDEGGAIMQGLVRAMPSPVALVGIAEKGYISVELTVHAPGGHSSMPPAETAVGILSAAIARLERRPMPAAIRGATAQMLDYVGPELAFPERLAVANRWLFGGLIAGRLGTTPEGNAMLRTTTAPTMLQAGVKDNVLPSSARGVVNFRILPGDTPDLVLAHVRATIRDPRVDVRRYESFLSQPSPVSDVGSPNFRLLERTIRQVAPEAIVVPWLVVGGTDARHYTALTPDVYRFSAARMGPGDLERVHGTNERLAVASYGQIVQFYVLLLRNAAGGS